VTVYVDNIRVPARVGTIAARWSHLFVAPGDDLAELHAFAAGIGLRRGWFQDKHPLPHYDVTDSKRQQAITAGAVAISWKATGQFAAQARSRDRS
jgi:hypothetical protein